MPGVKGLIFRRGFGNFKIKSLERKNQKIIVYLSKIDIQFMEKIYAEKLPEWMKEYDRMYRDKVVEEDLK